MLLASLTSVLYTPDHIGDEHNHSAHEQASDYKVLFMDALLLGMTVTISFSDSI